MWPTPGLKVKVAKHVCNDLPVLAHMHVTFGVRIRGSALLCSAAARTCSRTFLTSWNKLGKLFQDCSNCCDCLLAFQDVSRCIKMFQDFGSRQFLHVSAWPWSTPLVAGSLSGQGLHSLPIRESASNFLKVLRVTTSHQDLFEREHEYLVDIQTVLGPQSAWSVKKMLIWALCSFSAPALFTILFNSPLDASFLPDPTIFRNEFWRLLTHAAASLAAP